MYSELVMANFFMEVLKSSSGFPYWIPSKLICYQYSPLRADGGLPVLAANSTA
jgi:hypothetical protein